MPETRKSSGEAAYDTLLHQIRAGTFRPGDRLREEDVAARLSLSRTPVREALRRLESDGIVEHRPRVGAVIRTLSHTEVVDLYEMRIVLERSAAEMAAKHGARAEFAAMEGLNARIAEARADPQAGAAINEAFHRRLYLAGRNPFLLAASRALSNALILLGPTTYSDPARIDMVVAQHGDILAALIRGDAQAAGDAAEAHLQASLVYRLQRAGP